VFLVKGVNLEVEVDLEIGLANDIAIVEGTIKSQSIGGKGNDRKSRIGINKEKEIRAGVEKTNDIKIIRIMKRNTLITIKAPSAADYLHQSLRLRRPKSL
jgi:hypothetical protein